MSLQINYARPFFPMYCYYISYLSFSTCHKINITLYSFFSKNFPRWKMSAFTFHRIPRLLARHNGLIRSPLPPRYLYCPGCHYPFSSLLTMASRKKDDKQQTLSKAHSTNASSVQAESLYPQRSAVTYDDIPDEVALSTCMWNPTLCCLLSQLVLLMIWTPTCFLLSSVGPMSSYKNLVVSGMAREDEFQRGVVQILHNLHDRLQTYDPPLIPIETNADDKNSILYRVFDTISLYYRDLWYFLLHTQASYDLSRYPNYSQYNRICFQKIGPKEYICMEGLELEKQC